MSACMRGKAEVTSDLGLLPARGYRMPGLPQLLLEGQRRAVIEVHPRATFEADPVERARLEAEARANPRPSDLLDRLQAGQPVVINRRVLGGRSYPLPPDAPAWLSDPCGGIEFVVVHPDGHIAPSDGPADARCW
jgi:hypothetical protein